MPKVSPEHEQRRRQQILAAAMACFARQGYRATSMEDIVRESGLSVGAIYTYFPSKEDLFLTLLDQHTEGTLDRLNTIFRQPGSMAERGDRAVDFFFAQLDDDLVPLARVSREFWAEASSSERVQARQAQHCDRLRQFYVWLLTESQRQGALRPDVDIEAAAELLMALNEGILILHVAGMRRVAAGALKRAYRELLDHGLTLRPADSAPESASSPTSASGGNGHATPLFSSPAALAAAPGPTPPSPLSIAPASAPASASPPAPASPAAAAAAALRHPQEVSRG